MKAATTAIAVIALAGCAAPAADLTTLSAPPSPTAAPSPTVDARTPVTFDIADGNSRPQTIGAGTWEVTVTTDRDCFYGLDLRTVEDGDRVGLPAVEGNDTATGMLYGVEAGDYYLRVNTGPKCGGTVELVPE